MQINSTALSSSASPAAAKYGRIHLWMPNMFEFKGGIQVYSAFLLQALESMSIAERYEIFLKHDRSVSLSHSGSSGSHFHCLGGWAPRLRTSAFAACLAAYGAIQRPNLILATHLHFTPVADWLKQLFGIPYWTVAHGVEAWNIEKPALQRALRNADRILAVSSYTRDRLLEEQSLDPTRVLLLPNTFDANRFQIVPKPAWLLESYHLAAHQPVILTVARLDSQEQYKGYDQILHALPDIRRQLPDVHYLLVGKGNDRDRINQLMQELNLQDCVTLAGFVPDEQLPGYYALCDVFAMPSQGEGFGIVYLEALACGKPTLAGDRDGAIDALSNGELGVLVDPLDRQAIAETLTRILQRRYAHPILYQPHALRQKVIEKFGFERFQATVSELF